MCASIIKPIKVKALNALEQFVPANDGEMIKFF
jgi:hypothetical protein